MYCGEIRPLFRRGVWANPSILAAAVVAGFGAARDDIAFDRHLVIRCLPAVEIP